MRPQHFSPAARAVPGFLPKRRPWKSGCQRAAVYDSPTINPDGAARAARDAALEALAPLGTLGAGVWGGDAIYLWARLPPGARALRCLAARPGPAPGACAPAAGPGSGERPLPRLPMRVARAGLARVHTGLSWLGRPPGGCWSRRQRECRFTLLGHFRAGCDDDRAVVAWLVHAHKVAVIPGSACGCAGHIRVAFGQPAPGPFREAAARLGGALRQLAAQGFGVVQAWRDAGG